MSDRLHLLKRKRVTSRLDPWMRHCFPQLFLLFIQKRRQSAICARAFTRFENCWCGAVNIFNRGAQKNFVQFKTVLKTERPDLLENWKPSAEEFWRLVAKAILFRDI